MKNKCLDDFYKNLETKTDSYYVDSIKELIEKDNLTEDSLAELITKEVKK